MASPPFRRLWAECPHGNWRLIWSPFLPSLSHSSHKTQVFQVQLVAAPGCFDKGSTGSAVPMSHRPALNQCPWPSLLTWNHVGRIRRDFVDFSKLNCLVQLPLLKVCFNSGIWYTPSYHKVCVWSSCSILPSRLLWLS